MAIPQVKLPVPRKHYKRYSDRDLLIAINENVSSTKYFLVMVIATQVGLKFVSTTILDVLEVVTSFGLASFMWAKILDGKTPAPEHSWVIVASILSAHALVSFGLPSFGVPIPHEVRQVGGILTMLATLYWLAVTNGRSRKLLEKAIEKVNGQGA